MSVNVDIKRFETKGIRTLGVGVRNNGPDPIPQLFVTFEWVNEQHQPNPDGSRTAGGGLLLDFMTLSKAPLQPGEERDFFLSVKNQQEQVESRAASLSSDRYQFLVYSGEQVITRVEGRDLGAALDGIDQPLIDS